MQLAQLISIATLLVSGAQAANYTCVGSLIFGRHNDRKTKPAVILTPIGAQQQVEIGTFFKERYFGSDSDFSISGLDANNYYQANQFYGTAPDSAVILASHYSFLQGLYPPSGDVVADVKTLNAENLAELANGTAVSNPLDGYQYVISDVVLTDAPENIWFNGVDSCPAFNTQSNAAMASAEFQEYNKTTLDFFQSLSDVLPADEFPSWELNFGNAYSVFDYMKVNSVHNETFAQSITPQLLSQVSYYDDIYQRFISYNESVALKESALSLGGQTMAGRILTLLNATVNEQQPYLNYMTGSFNIMYQFFYISQLTEASELFTGMPEYGATLVFDVLVDESNNKFIQFSYKNGTSADLIDYPLFNGTSSIISWSSFASSMGDIAITELSDWCTRCGATIPMCASSSDAYEDGTKLSDAGVNLDALLNGDYSSLDISSPSLSNAAAGGIGAGVTLGVVFILAALHGLFKLKKKRTAQSVLPVTEMDNFSDSTKDGETTKSSV